jgi:large subunit ribosomal protein L6
MSRVGKQLIGIPTGTTVSVSGITVVVKGPKGELTRDFRPELNIIVEGDHVKVSPKKEDKQTISLWGTTASHIKNMVQGVNTPYTKELILEGVGFKSEVKGAELILALGFSHLVHVPIPASLAVKAEKNIITISGINKEEVGSFSASVRALKKPEPYKGKGFRYRNEVIRRKEGKKSV